MEFSVDISQSSKINKDLVINTKSNKVKININNDFLENISKVKPKQI